MTTNTQIFNKCLDEIRSNKNLVPSEIMKCADCGKYTFLNHYTPACFTEIIRGTCCNKSTCRDGCSYTFPCGCIYNVSEWEGYKFDAKCTEHNTTLNLSQDCVWYGDRFSDIKKEHYDRYIRREFEDMGVSVPETVNEIHEY